MNMHRPGGSLSGLSDLDIQDPETGDVLLYDIGAGFWYNTPRHPIGQIITAPTSPGANYLECLGQVLAQADYPELFAAIGLIGFSPYTVFKSAATASVTKTDAGYGEGIFVLTGNSGTSVYVSTDEGLSWTTVSAAAANGVAYSPALDLWAITAGDTIYTASNPSATWTARTASSGGTLYGICWDSGNSIFVAVGLGGEIFSSTNGTSWTARTSGTAVKLSGVASSGDIIVAVGASGTVLSSTDGISWTARTSGTAVALGVSSGSGGIIYGGGYFVAGSSGNDGVLIYSTDGISWSTILPPAEFRGLALGKLGYHNGRFFVAPLSTAQALMGSFSGPGTDWQITPIPSSAAVGGIACSDSSIILATAGSSVMVAPSTVSFHYDNGTHFALPDFPILPAPLKAWIKAA